MKVVIVCGFFESTLVSFRENQFAARLPLRGHEVRVITSTESHIWRYNRAKIKPLRADQEDNKYSGIPGLQIIRRRPILRIGDLVFFRVGRADFEDADVVHVLDFRQGVTALAARISANIGKPVVYDHEQRGDRVDTVFHRLDSLIRRALIRFGSKHVSLMRHTVNSNRQYFLSVASDYQNPHALSPLGVDERIFFRNDELREETRQKLGVGDSEFVWVVSGKIDTDKRPLDVIRAVRDLGRGDRVFLVGPISKTVSEQIIGLEHVTSLGRVDPKTLNAIYNASDCCVFTTFTVSYWEAISSGTSVLVPRTSFSEEYLSNRRSVHLFGEPSMFEVEEERYRQEYDLATALKSGMQEVVRQERGGSDINWLSWESRIDELERQYVSLLRKA